MRSLSGAYVRVPEVLPLISLTILSASTVVTTKVVSRFLPVRTVRSRYTAASPALTSGRSARRGACARQACVPESTNTASTARGPMVHMWSPPPLST